MAKKTGRARSGASPPKPPPQSPTPTTAASGLTTPRRHRSDTEEVQVVAYWSQARRCWSVCADRWKEGKYYDFQFSGRLLIHAKNDFDIVLRYLRENFPMGMLPNIGAWTGLRNWIQQHADVFVGGILYVERGKSEVVVPEKERG
jgi:hypothetical protein